MRLNNGKKWKADSPARNGFSKMVAIEQAFSEKVKSPRAADYSRLANDIQTELDIIFKECRMKGEGHNQLHKLLEMVIADVKVLKGNDEKASAKALSSLRGHLNTFQKYFE